jgi:alkanesulfonate monooxygenase SsuD/methylene tetrahydromethanopterin reductase-like flavin-dependent oxidoreductase (luciferase family)
MKIGYCLDTHAGPYDGPVPDRDTVARSMDAFLEEGRLCDEVGFDSVQVPERHMRTETHFPPPLQLLTALAVTTERVKLATHTLVLTLYHPMQVAEASTVIDNLSRGRLILTVAMGYHDDYWRMFGMTRLHRRDRFIESVEILHKAFAGERFDYHGTHFDLDDVELLPRPYQPGGPELWMGGHFEPAIERAGRMADGWCGDPFPIQPEVWWPRIETYRNAASETGRPAKVVILRDAWVAPTREAALEALGDHFVQEHRFYYRWGIFPPSEEFPTESSITAESLARHQIVGSPEECAEQLIRYNEEFDVDYCCVRMRTPTGPSFDATTESIRQFGEEVIPAVERATGGHVADALL